jgi:KipI family sensor histidine kinase inhibitor
MRPERVELKQPIRVADDRIAITGLNPAHGQALAARLRRLPGCIEAVGGIATVECQFDLCAISGEAFMKAVQGELSGGDIAPDRPGRLHEIPVVYGGAAGPDLPAVCAAVGLTRDEFVRRHTERVYTVAMLGFTPGFAYLDGLDESLACARRETPRQWVAAGSVGIAGSRAGVYALDGPGGWQIVGRTDLTLFDASAREPFRLGPGDRIRFMVSDA